MENNKKVDSKESLIKTLCYLGIFVLLLFIILPPLFRLIFPEEKEYKKEEKKESIMNLTCVKTEDFVDYQLKTNINNTYIDSKINKSIFTYEIEYNDNVVNEKIIIEEYEKLKRVNNIDFNEEENKYMLIIDYANFDYSTEPLLLDHQNIIADQLEYYTSNNFECKTKTVQ